ncbi:MAG: putative molybdenum carrier protein [Desulfobacter sp.]
MLKKIVSGGQTGVDRAALDVAIKFGIPHGGWITKGRKTEAGPLPRIYRLKEMDTADYPSRTRQNILDSHGTVIISRGPLTGGSKLTHSFSRTKGKPHCHIDLLEQDIFEAAVILQSFILENRIRTLNVAGPRASHDSTIYSDVKSVMEAVLYLFYLDFEAGADLPAFGNAPGKRTYPKSLDQAVAGVVEALCLKTKARVARLDDSQIRNLYFAWMDPVREYTGLDENNSPLLAALRQLRKTGPEYTVEDGIMDIIKAVKQFLADNYRLRVL